MTVSSKPCRPGPGVLAGGEHGEEVLAQLGAQGLLDVTGLAELSEGAWGGCVCHVFHASRARNAAGQLAVQAGH